MLARLPRDTEPPWVPALFRELFIARSRRLEPGGRLTTDGSAATFRDAVVVGEFQALWLAQALSLMGDQLARVALSALIFARTHSAAWTAVAYAITFLPWLLGGPMLSGIADRLPRRGVMVGCDVARAMLLALMALPRVPIGVICVLIFAAELFQPPFSAARAALLPDIFPDDRYVVANAIGNITGEVAQLLGFAGGGLLIVLVEPRGALALDAATFLLSALLLHTALRARPAAAGRRATQKRSASISRGTSLILRDIRLRPLVALAWLCAFYIVPEGLAAPLAAGVESNAVAIGLVMAANPAGTVLGAAVLARCVRPATRLRLMPALAVLSVAPLIAFAAHPPLAIMLVLLVISGVGSSYNLPANAAFVAAVPAQRRGSAFGVVQTGMYVGQGAAVALGGALASVVDATTVVAIGGALGLVVAGLLWRPLSAMATHT